MPALPAPGCKRLLAPLPAIRGTERIRVSKRPLRRCPPGPGATGPDPAAAPKGQDTLYVLVPVGHLDERSEQDWEALVNRARETVFARLAKEMGVRDLREHIKFEIAYWPPVWKDRFNLEKGAAFGLSHNFWQVGYLRPQNRHKQYKNLYFTGASTHPGTGLPIVLLSARLTTERILKEAGTISVQNLNYAKGHPIPPETSQA